MRNSNCTIKCLLAFTLMIGSPIAAIEAGATPGIEIVEQQGKVFSQRNGWYEVRSGQETVWITSQFAKRSAKQTPDMVTVAVEGPVRLRLGPGGKDSGLRVDFDDTFKYLGEKGNWYKISYKGKVYWISKDCAYAE